MPNQTPRLGLNKPLQNEVADISVLNGNFDILDQQVALQKEVFGVDDKSVNLVKALIFSIDTRSTSATRTNGRYTKFEEKDGSTVVKSTSIEYDGFGRVSKVTEIAGGKMVVTTINYNTDGTFAGSSRTVT